MARDDSRAQVQLDEDTLAARRRVLGEDHPDTLTSASNLAMSLRAAREYQGPGSFSKTPWPAAAASSARTTPETMGSAAFDLILRGLAIGGEPEWMAALREAPKRPGS
jgi:hypothetical protein